MLFYKFNTMIGVVLLLTLAERKALILMSSSQSRASIPSMSDFEFELTKSLTWRSAQNLRSSLLSGRLSTLYKKHQIFEYSFNYSNLSLSETKAVSNRGWKNSISKGAVACIRNVLRFCAKPWEWEILPVLSLSLSWFCAKM